MHTNTAWLPEARRTTGPGHAHAPGDWTPLPGASPGTRAAAEALVAERMANPRARHVTFRLRNVVTGATVDMTR